MAMAARATAAEADLILRPSKPPAAERPPATAVCSPQPTARASPAHARTTKTISRAIRSNVVRAAEPPPRSSTPDEPRDLHAAGELSPLIILGDLVAVDRRRKAALMTQRALIEIHVPARLFDPRTDGGDALELGMLRAHQPEHDSLLRRHEAKR